jgi:hypothetical protein
VQRAGLEPAPTPYGEADLKSAAFDQTRPPPHKTLQCKLNHMAGFHDFNHDLEFIMYLVFGQPKTQNEAIEIVYERDYTEVNVKPFRDARVRLMNAGKLDSDGKLRNAEFEAVDHNLSVEEIKSHPMITRNDSGRLTVDNEEKYGYLMDIIK